MIGCEDGELYGIELPKTLDNPIVNIKYPITTHKLRIPTVHDSNNISNSGSKKLNENSGENEEKVIESFSVLTNQFLLQHEQWRMQKYSIVKNFRNIKNPDYYYTDSLKDETEMNIKKKEHDKKVLNLMKDCILAKQAEKAVDLFDLLMLKKTKDLAIQLVESLDTRNDIGDILKNKLKLQNFLNSKQIENKNNHNMQNYFLNNEITYNNKNHNFINLKKEIEHENDNEKKNGLGALALKLDYKSIEEEVKYELENLLEGNDQFSNSNNIEELNSINNKIMKDFSILEKKQVKLLYLFCYI